jgi:hypothetical protein
MLASPPPHIASTRRSVCVEILGAVTITLPGRGVTFTITGAPLAVGAGTGAGVFAETRLTTVGAGDAGAAGGAVEGIFEGT